MTPRWDVIFGICSMYVRHMKRANETSRTEIAFLHNKCRQKIFIRSVPTCYFLLESLLVSLLLLGIMSSDSSDKRWAPCIVSYTQTGASITSEIKILRASNPALIPGMLFVCHTHRWLGLHPYSTKTIRAIYFHNPIRLHWWYERKMHLVCLRFKLSVQGKRATLRAYWFISVINFH